MPELKFAKPKKDPDAWKGALVKSELQKGIDHRRNGKVREFKLNAGVTRRDPEQTIFSFARTRVTPTADPNRFVAPEKVVKVVIPECRRCHARLVSAMPAKASKPQSPKPMGPTGLACLFFFNIKELDGQLVVFRNGQTFLNL